MYIAIDIGGTSTRIASTKDLKTILEVSKFDTKKTLLEQKELILKTIAKLTHNTKPQAICAGVPGIIDKKNKRFKKLPNLNYLNEANFSELISFDKNLYIENDAALAGLGEATRGSAQKHETVAYITLSTGVGGARIYSKQLDKDQAFFEPGHIIISIGGDTHDTTKISGSFESYCSGTSFERRYRVDPKDCSDTTIWEDYAYYLSAGITSVISMWAPEIIVLGGGISNRFDQFYSALKKYLNQQHFFDIPNIVPAILKDEAGIYGAFAHIVNQTKAV